MRFLIWLCLLHTVNGNGIGDQCFRYPWGLAIDPNGDIHAAAHGSNCIKVIKNEGVLVKTCGDLNCPIGIAIDMEGYSIVSESSGNCLSVYDPQRNKIHTLANLNYPMGTAIDPRDSSVYVANYGTVTVLKYCI